MQVTVGRGPRHEEVTVVPKRLLEGRVRVRLAGAEKIGMQRMFLESLKRSVESRATERPSSGILDQPICSAAHFHPVCKVLQ